jgi:D-lyxose ketol-isomerase
MKRSTLNLVCREAQACFARHHWALPPNPRWDVTDFGLGDFDRFGLVLITLTAEPEYCEKLMFARRGQTTPCHTHARKKEDIICRHGELGLRLWPARPDPTQAQPVTFDVPINGGPTSVRPGEWLHLSAGSRVTLVPGIWHEFAPASDECIIGEVSTANDDLHDNFFLDPAIGRFPAIEEDEPALFRLLSES